MKYYTDAISVPLAEKLKEKGMPMEESRYGIFPHFVAKDGVMYFPPTFASAFDWLMEKDVVINVIKSTSGASIWCGKVNGFYHSAWCNTWHEAAEKAIEKALELL